MMQFLLHDQPDRFHPKLVIFTDDPDLSEEIEWQAKDLPPEGKPEIWMTGCPDLHVAKTLCDGMTQRFGRDFEVKTVFASTSEKGRPELRNRRDRQSSRRPTKEKGRPSFWVCLKVPTIITVMATIKAAKIPHRDDVSNSGLSAEDKAAIAETANRTT